MRAVWVVENEKCEPDWARADSMPTEKSLLPGQRVRRYFPERDWIAGCGADLPENTWAYVNHPVYGVQLAQCKCYEDGEFDEGEPAAVAWLLHDLRKVVPRTEATDYQLLGAKPLPPERAP